MDDLFGEPVRQPICSLDGLPSALINMNSDLGGMTLFSKEVMVTEKSPGQYTLKVSLVTRFPRL